MPHSRGAWAEHGDWLGPLAAWLAGLAVLLVFLPAGASGLAALLWLGVSLLGLMLGRWTVQSAQPVGPGLPPVAKGWLLQPLFWLLAWAGWMFVTAAWSPRPLSLLARDASHVAILLTVPAMSASLRAPAAHRLLKIFVCAALLLGLAWLWHRVTPFRSGGLLSSMVHYAGNKSISNGVLMALAAAVAAHLAAQHRPWWLAAAALAALVLWRSPSRTAHLVLVVLAAALLLERLGRRTWQLALVATLAAAAVVVLVASWNSSRGDGGAAARGAAGQLQASNDMRMDLYRSTLQMVAERPLAGHGLGSWEVLWQQRGTREDMRSFNTAHNAPLQLAAEGGLMAVALLGLAVWCWVRQAIRAGPAGTAINLVLLAFGVAALFNAVLRDAVFTSPLVVLLSVALAAARPQQGSALPGQETAAPGQGALPEETAAAGIQPPGR